jgi:hypothetical protein
MAAEWLQSNSQLAAMYSSNCWHPACEQQNIMMITHVRMDAML